MGHIMCTQLFRPNVQNIATYRPKIYLSETGRGGRGIRICCTYYMTDSSVCPLRVHQTHNSTQRKKKAGGKEEGEREETSKSRRERHATARNWLPLKTQPID